MGSSAHFYLLSAHGGLVVVHVVLFYLAILGIGPSVLHRITTIQTAITLATSVLGTICTNSLLTLTQRFALRRNLAQPQTLTTLHDRTTSWSGLFSGISVMFQARAFSGHIFLIVLYLGLIFGLHTTIPALLTIYYHAPPQIIAVPIVQMTPHMNTSTESAAIMPWQYLSATVVLPTPGLRGSTIQDTLQPQKADYVFVPDNADTIDQTSAYVCVTTFRPTCEVMTGTRADSSSNASEALGWGINLSDGWMANIDPLMATANTSTNGISSAIKIVPAPRASNASQPEVPYVTLLALWNVTDASGRVYNTIHISNGSEIIDMTFLRCILEWDVCSSKASSIYQNADVCVSGARECARSDTVPVDQRTDPTKFDWSSIWTQGISWNNGELPVDPGVGVVDGSLSPAEHYLMDILGWQFDNYGWDISGAVGLPPMGQLPTLENMTDGLANMTATIFWLSSWMSNRKAVLPYGVVAQEAASVKYATIQVSIVAAAGGLVLSLLALVVVFIIILLPNHDNRPISHNVNSTGVLQLAWLFSREPGVIESLKVVGAPTDTALRGAGKDINWRSQSRW